MKLLAVAALLFSTSTIAATNANLIMSACLLKPVRVKSL